jgi:uncharacterized protein (TIRG00374 family)
MSRIRSAVRRAPVILALRIAVSTVLLVILFRKVHLEQAFPDRPGVSAFIWFGCGVVCVLGGIWFSAWRWQRVLLVFDAYVPVRRLLSISLAGQFLGNVLPSTIGGDVLRVSRCAHNTSRETAIASVVLERLTGFLMLPLLVLIGFALDPSLFETSRAWVALLIAGVALSILFGAVLLGVSTRLGGRFQHHTNWKRYIGAIHLGLARMRREPKETLGVAIAAFAFQCTTVLTVIFAAHTVGASVPTAALIAFTPAVAMVQVLPISISGLGVREGTFALLLHGLGVPTGKSVAIGLCWYFMTLIASFVGAPTFALGARTLHKTDIDA